MFLDREAAADSSSRACRAPIRAIAPFIEDVRFATSGYAGVDEYAIADGELRFRRGFASEDLVELCDYFYEQVADRSRDEELRRFVARLCIFIAEQEERYFARGVPHEPPRYGRYDDVRRVLDRALALDDRNPQIWRLRGRFARAMGELEEAERCFARAQELETTPVAGFELALTAFAMGRDATARERVERVVAALPDHTGAKLLAGLLAHRAGAPEVARAHVHAVVRTIEDRCAAITPLQDHRDTMDWGSLEPSLLDLVQTGRHIELFDWYLEQLGSFDRSDGKLLRGAAAYLLALASLGDLRDGSPVGPELLRITVRLYTAAAELDPLAGSVHYRRSLFDRWWGPPGLGRTSLEQALAINPDHLGALTDLGRLHCDLGEYDRAIELLERALAVLSAAYPPGSSCEWDGPASELAAAHYARAYQILNGVPWGANRPPGHPSEDALTRADAAADRALEVLHLIFDHEDRERLPYYLLKASVAAFREQYQDALVWAERALELDEANPHALYALACIDAKRGGDREAVLRRLARVLELRPEGRQEIANEPDLAPLRNAPEFRALVGG